MGLFGGEAESRQRLPPTSSDPADPVKQGGLITFSLILIGIVIGMLLTHESYTRDVTLIRT